MGRLRPALAVGLLVGGAALGACAEAPAGPLPTPPETRPAVRAMTLDARRPLVEADYDSLAALGATHVVVVPFAFQETGRSADLRFRPDVRWYSESGAGVRRIAREMGARGVGVIVKPQVWVGDGTWSADVDPGDWTLWEAGYRAFALHWAGVAAEVGADVFVVGTELAAAAEARGDFWRGLVADVRAVYPGRVTYAANWDRYDKVPFWDALDLVGVQAYFPVDGRGGPSAAWARHGDALAAFAARAGRPVLFTEAGYRPSADAAREPWLWDSDAAPDPALQARLYAALFEATWAEPWFEGVLVWKWLPPAPPGERGGDGFDVRGQPAAEVVRRWFAAPPDAAPPDAAPPDAAQAGRGGPLAGRP